MAPGSQERPSFSPDGETLAFDWEAPKESHRSVYVQRLDASTPVRFSKGVVNERRPVWSPDGHHIALLRDVGPNRLAIVSIPLVGMEERKWAEFQRGATPVVRLVAG